MSFLDTTLSKIVTPEQALLQVQEWKRCNESIVFTNGCFDIIHKGHVFYLSKARDLGTKLILGLNTDESISRLKGPNRPIKELESRALTLAAFGCIDMIIPFGEDTPLDLITLLLPHILVKGSDYVESNIVGADVVKSHGGNVITIDFVEGYSSTNYFNKI